MTWIESISKGIANVLEKCRKPAKTVPAVLLLCEMSNRPGLSAIALTSAIISRLSEAGIVSELNPDGTPNKTCMMIRIMMEEIVNEFHNNAFVEGAQNSGEITSIGTGANAGGPITITSTNALPFGFKALVR